jgi:NDP-sugar pyrophosphorylase family protein
MMPEGAKTNLSPSIRMGNDYPTRAVILAAGRGTRLEPFTNKVPKPLLPVKGRSMLDWTLRALSKARVTETCIVVSHFAEQIVDYVADGRVWDMDVKISYQQETLGTADALQSAAEFLIEPCFVLAGDYALREKFLLELKRCYLAGTADFVVSVKEIPREEARHRSSILLGEDDRILQILEKPAIVPASDTLGASLVYIVPPEIRQFLKHAPLSRRGEFELPELVNLMIGSGFSGKGLVQEVPREWNGEEPATVS